MSKEELLEQVKTFFDYLTTRDLPQHWHRRRLRKLPAEQAFEVIYYLQEKLHILPDTFEMCKTCHCLFDTEAEGHMIDVTDRIGGKPVPEKYHGTYCDNCVPEPIMEGL